MKYFLYDENEKRLILVDDIFPTVLITTHAAPHHTPSSSQERAYKSLYVWENVTLLRYNSDDGRDHEIWSLNEKGLTEKKIMTLPHQDIYLIEGGAYIYNKS